MGNPVWFQQILGEAYEKAGSWEALEKALGGRTRNTISGWDGEHGRPPKLDDVIRLLEYTGRDAGNAALTDHQIMTKANPMLEKRNREMEAALRRIVSDAQRALAENADPSGVLAEVVKVKSNTSKPLFKVAEETEQKE